MSRRQAREFALQVLFHIDVGRAEPQEALRQAFAREAETGAARASFTASDTAYAETLVNGTWEHRDEIDGKIARYAREWTVDRMAGVDRNILRLAIYEVMHVSDVPDGVAADEAVELAKTFSTGESGKFINGVLGSVIRGLRATPDAGVTPDGGAPARE